MLTYNDVRTFVDAGLDTLGYGTSGHPDKPMYLPGPPTIQSLYSLSPNSILFLTVGNGIGLKVEGTYDQPFIVVRVIGPQNDYDTAEALAHDLDGMFFDVQNETLGATRTLYITRNAPPQLVDFDSASRYHFQTTYIAEATR